MFIVILLDKDVILNKQKMDHIGLAAKVAPFLIMPRTSQQNSEKVKLSRMINGEKRMAEIVKYKTVDTEALCKLYLAFEAVRGPDGLNLNSPDLLFLHFRRCLDEKFHLKFDRIKSEQGAATVDGFYETLRLFLVDVIPLPAAALKIQHSYMGRYKKPANVSCVQLAERLEEIKSMSRVLTDDFTPKWTEHELKDLFFGMMADHHQVYFLRLNSTKLNDDDYSLSQLAQDMQIQMHLSQAEASVRSPFRQQRSDRQTYGERPQQYRRLNYGGRGSNYGGRSSWRTNYGQGYGANNFGPYQGGRGFSNNYQSGRSINYNSGRGFG